MAPKKVKSKAKNKLTRNDAKVFASFMNSNIPASIKKVSERTGLSWPTVKKHMNILAEEGMLHIEKTKKKTLMRIHDNYWPDPLRELGIKSKK